MTTWCCICVHLQKKNEWIANKKKNCYPLISSYIFLVMNERKQKKMHSINDRYTHFLLFTKTKKKITIDDDK